MSKGKNYNSSKNYKSNVQPRLQVTTFDDLRSYANGSIVKLPPFSDGKPLVAKMQRPSIMEMATEGKIPNTLMRSATDLFSGKGIDDEKNENALSDMFKICTMMAKLSLVSPTYEDIKNAGLNLTDEQLIFIFRYVQKGVTDLEGFRKEQQNT